MVNGHNVCLHGSYSLGKFKVVISMEAVGAHRGHSNVLFDVMGRFSEEVRSKVISDGRTEILI